MNKNTNLEIKSKTEWQPMKLSLYGKVSNIVQVGLGKTIICTADPGEPKKVPVRG